ncbi:hypothetical protein BEWA_025450 [Theileria equi strain WA]|uniref:Uncharacterized protein n=1 Tax=Theileria equi strain WA TaxID=1537102 RepID=L0AXE3_THEEQ|nr:hypothetical protein BEWA_025450 [Theileria equi strain WA]AFZ79696.1 hypothetical protein BEWA_025450 [Theileria equi strain WA]|eukprot:XP_004829362.1 hypothetical protein BEWA_025450 [Theileria equi strain WA]
MPNAMSPSFLEAFSKQLGEKPLGSVESPKVINGQEVCTLIPGIFGLSIQLVLCIISIAMLLLKYQFEYPKRPLKVFLMDFIQLMCGSSTVHVLNILSSIMINKLHTATTSFVSDECNLYFITTIFDATIGVYIEYKIIKYLAIKRAAQNYLTKNRKSKFTPNLQELRDATELAKYSIYETQTTGFLDNASVHSNSIAQGAKRDISIATDSHIGVTLDTFRSSTTEQSAISMHISYDSDGFASASLGSDGSGSMSRLLSSDGSSGVPRLSSRIPAAVTIDTFSEEYMDDNALNDPEDQDNLISDLDGEPESINKIDALLKRYSTVYNLWSRKKGNREFLLNLYTWITIVSGLKIVSIFFFALFSYHINLISSYILHPFNHSHKLKLIFVMIISPLFLNVFQYYATDSIIKIKIPLNH